MECPGAEDECVEVTPEIVRVRKVELTASLRARPRPAPSSRPTPERFRRRKPSLTDGPVHRNHRIP